MKKLLLSFATLAMAAVAFAGNGTLASPYTCAEVIALDPQSTSEAVQSGVWVEGYIVGSYGNQAANILISDNASAAYPDNKAEMVCVQLLAGSETRTALNVVDNPDNVGKKCAVFGDVMKYNSMPGIKNTSGYSFNGNTVGGNQGGETPVVTPTDKIFNIDFTKGQGNFTIENVTLPEGLSYVWAQDKSYGMKASAYADGAAHTSEAWLISPEIDLNGASEVGLEFTQALNKFTDVSSFATNAQVYARVAGGAWEAVEGIAYPTSQSWTFVSSGIVSLEKYVGKKIQIGFKYVSTAEDCGTWEIKALNIYGKGGSVVTPEAETVADIAAFIAKASTANAVKIAGATTAIYQNGRYLWIKDASANILVYGEITEKYNNGDAIPGGIEGLYELRYGVSQFTAPVAESFKPGTAGTPVQPELILCEDVSLDLANQYVMLKGVTITATENSKNFNITDASEVDVVLYDQFGIVSAAENVTVVGFVSAYNTTVQVIATEILSASGKQVVTAPTFNPAGGEVLAGTEVTIATTTEGASIYYTLDGTEPTTASTLYTAPIAVTKALTIKALAAKEGMDNSEVVEATYTVKTIENPVGNTATFDWTAPSTLDPAQTTPVVTEGDESTRSVYVGGITFVNNGVACTINDANVAQTSQKARLYKPTNAAGDDLPVELRTYKLTIIEISVNPDYAITGIEFVGGKASNTQLEASCGTLDGKVWTAPETAVSSVTFNTIATTNIQQIIVTVADKAGIADITVDTAAPAVYYNLQGVQMPADALTPGLYIRRQGNATTKVIVR